MEQPNLEPCVEELPNIRDRESVLDDRASRLGNFIGEVTVNALRTICIGGTVEVVDSYLLGNKLPFMASLAITAGILMRDRK